MSDAQNLKVFTAEELAFQALNRQNDHFVARINERVESADCVSTNTANKIVKRDASGNFAAGTITANLVGNVTGNLTGNVTGNADTATLATASDGGVRFWLSGCVGGSPETTYSINADTDISVQQICCKFDSTMQLKLKRARFYLVNDYLRLRIILTRLISNSSWTSPTYSGEITPEYSFGTGDYPTIMNRIIVEIYNPTTSVQNYTSHAGWWIEFVIE